MNQVPPPTSPDDDDIDDVLTRHLERFLEAWETNGIGPCLADHLPSAAADVRRLVLVELIKVDLENRFATDGPVLKLEDYAAENPELLIPDGMPVDLIYEEFHVRQATGETIITDEWLKRFPDKADQLRQLLDLDNESSGDSLTGTQLSETWQPGDRIADFYLMSALGTGAFGSVFLARQESMQRMVALKVSADKGTEAQTLAQLDHPNIVRVFDQTRLPEQDLRLLYMQFAAGGTLQSVVKASREAKVKTGAIIADCIAAALDHTGVLSSDNVSLKSGLADKSWSEVTCQLGMELARALHYAHGQGILHRDVKPANVLLAANGTAKLADFNISFHSAAEGSSPAAYFGGSLAYMSPEQLAAFDPSQPTQPADLDERSDVFSLGVLLWELLFGTRPYADESVTGKGTDMLGGMIRLRQQGVTEPVEETTGPVTGCLVTILKRCLAPNPDDRYQTAAELAHELGLCLQPRVAKLVHDSKTGWRGWAIDHPLTAFLTAAIAPHGLAAAFNYFYNDREIQAQLPESVANDFIKIVIAVNAIAFPVGFWFCIRFSAPVINTLRAGVDAIATDTRLAARLRAFRLSRFVTFLGITEWFIAGMIYPVALHVLTGGLAAKWYIHFIGSLLICGLVAAAYPFFMTATVTVRSFLPALLKNDQLRADDLKELHCLSEQSAWSLYLAGGVPAAGIMILLTTQEATNDNSAFALRALSIVGAVGFAIVLSLASSLQADIEALQEASRLVSTDD